MKVGILDRNLRLVRKSFFPSTSTGPSKYCDLIHHVPWKPTVGEILDHVSVTYFKPPLGQLTAYEYQGKQGYGTPKPLPGTTTLDMMRERSSHRKIASTRITYYGMADLCGYSMLFSICVTCGILCDFITFFGVVLIFLFRLFHSRP